MQRKGKVTSMFKYKGVHCPYCNKEFTESDQIVICPECGAPYHKECVNESGGCILTSLHEKGEQWQPPKVQSDEEKYDGNASKRCSRCGTINSPDKLFCEVCGNDLNKQEPGETPPSSSGANQNPYGSYQQAPPNFMAYNPYTTPFGGVGPDEEIDGLPVKDLTLYVRDNTPYFIPRFKTFAKVGKGSGWNWCAFFFDFYYFIYRKMWGMAILAFVVSTVLSIPSLIYTFQMMQAMTTGLEAMPDLPASFWLASQVCSMLSWVVKGLFGGFANRLYAQQTFKRVHKLKKQHGDAPDYSTILSAKGGTSKVGLILCIVIPFVLSFIASIVYVFANISY